MRVCPLVHVIVRLKESAEYPKRTPNCVTKHILYISLSRARTHTHITTRTRTIPKTFHYNRDKLVWSCFRSTTTAKLIKCFNIDNKFHTLFSSHSPKTKTAKFNIMNLSTVSLAGCLFGSTLIAYSFDERKEIAIVLCVCIKWKTLTFVLLPFSISFGVFFLSSTYFLLLFLFSTHLFAFFVFISLLSSILLALVLSYCSCWIFFFYFFSLFCLFLSLSLSSSLFHISSLQAKQWSGFRSRFRSSPFTHSHLYTI